MSHFSSPHAIWLQSEFTNPPSTSWEPWRVPGQPQFRPLVSWTGLIPLGCWVLPQPRVPQEHPGCYAQASRDRWAVPPAGPLLPAPSSPLTCRTRRNTPRIAQAARDALQALRGLCPGLSTPPLLVWDLWRLGPEVQGVSSLLCLLFSSPLAWTTSWLFSFSFLRTPSLRACLRFLSASALRRWHPLHSSSRWSAWPHSPEPDDSCVALGTGLSSLCHPSPHLWHMRQTQARFMGLLRDEAWPPEAGRNHSCCAVATCSPLGSSPDAVDAPRGQCPLQTRDGGDHISLPSSGLCRPAGPRFSVLSWLHNCVWRKCTRDGCLQSWKFR